MSIFIGTPPGSSTDILKSDDVATLRLILCTFVSSRDIENRDTLAVWITGMNDRKQLRPKRKVGGRNLIRLGFGIPKNHAKTVTGKVNKMLRAICRARFLKSFC